MQGACISSHSADVFSRSHLSNKRRQYIRLISLNIINHRNGKKDENFSDSPSIKLRNQLTNFY